MSELEFMREIAFIMANRNGQGYFWWGDVPLYKKRVCLKVVKEHKEKYPHLWKELIREAARIRKNKADIYG